MIAALTGEALLLVGHIGGAILLIGPTSVAASLLPRYLVEAASGSADRSVARALHRITRGYGAASLVVPAIGLALAAQRGSLGQRWVVASLVVVAAGGALLWWGVVPAQARLLAMEPLPDPGDPAVAGGVRRLRMVTGLASASWVVVVVLMVTKPT